MSRISIHCPHCQLMNRLDTARISENPDCVRCKMDLVKGVPFEGTLANLTGLINSEQPLLVLFWATWCNACRNFEPVFERVSPQLSNVCFVKVDIQQQPSLAEQFNIRAIPTAIFFKQGKVVDTLNDALPEKRFKQWLEKALVK